MDNQHRKFKGYLELSQEEVDLINRIRQAGAELGELVDDLQSLSQTEKRWVNIGKTDLQKGLMALTRSVDNPERF
jgi:signal transduction histidine kinase